LKILNIYGRLNKGGVCNGQYREISDLRGGGADCKLVSFENCSNTQVTGQASRLGFTLSEVLITLGIIGVVAAMTMPTLIAKHRAQVLKTQFAKAYSITQQQVVYARQEFGIENFGNYCASYDGTNDGYINRVECSEMLNKQVKIIGSCNYKTPPKTYNKSVDAYMDIGGTARPRHLLADGTCYDVVVNAGTLGITVDTNGPSKGPNAVGHDIFAFWVDKNDKLIGPKATGALDDDLLNSGLDTCETPAPGSQNSCSAGVQQSGKPCSKTSKQKGNGLGCTWFAINDICPENPTKKYWECLP